MDESNKNIKNNENDSKNSSFAETILKTALENDETKKMFAEKIKENLSKTMDDLFRYGPVKDAIETQLKSVLIPYIEKYDMAAYIAKLDSVLSDIIQSTSLCDNKKLLENFRQLMTSSPSDSCGNTIEKSIKLSELFSMYCDYIANEIDTDGRDISYDSGEPEYETVSVEMHFEKENDRSWSCFEYAAVDFTVENESDENTENLGVTIHLSRYEREQENMWKLTVNTQPTISSLKHMESFEVFLLQLERCDIMIEVDRTDMDEEVYPENKPELTYQ